MRIGVAKEIKTDEYRVALRPAGARELTLHGHEVTLEQGAGEGSSFADSAYEAVGARIAAVDEVWAESELVIAAEHGDPDIRLAEAEPVARELPRKPHRV